MTTAFYVIKTYQSVFERRMRTLQFRSPGIAPGNVDESALGREIQEQDKIMERIEEFYSELFDSNQAVTIQTDPKEVPPIMARSGKRSS